MARQDASDDDVRAALRAVAIALHKLRSDPEDEGIVADVDQAATHVAALRSDLTTRVLRNLVIEIER
jgi:hypothetical protein